jgi:predicted amino acid racemase
MFVERLRKDNPRLIEAAVSLHQAGYLLPDSYVVDLEQFRRNAARIKKEADEKGIRLFFMLKQLGRNPYLAKELVRLGYEGAVTVDFKEAQVMMRHRIPVANIGHLVQVPQAMMQEVIAYGPRVVTVFSPEKARAVGQAAQTLGKVQKILIRVYDESDMIYSGQTAGIALSELPGFLDRMKDCPGVQVAGVTSFPCYLYQEELGDIAPTANLRTVQKAAVILKEHGIRPELLNTPSATCVRTLSQIAADGGNCGEPGHGLTGTTPAHAKMELEEKGCVAYVSEISHNFSGRGCCFGGGFYRRSHVKNALVGSRADQMRPLRVIPPSQESIDYHFELSAPCQVGETVVMAFRYQIFVTRSDVVLLEGVAQGRPRIAGVYDSLGNKKELAGVETEKD